MHLLDHAFRWIIQQIVTAVDMFGMSIMGVLGADLTLFRNIFPIVDSTYVVFLTFAISIILLNLVWGIFKNIFMPAGFEVEPPVQLVMKSIIFTFLAFSAWNITQIALGIIGVPYVVIMGVPDAAGDLDFVRTHAIMTLILAGGLKGALVALILALVFVIVIGWNYFKLMVSAVERYLVVGILVFTAPLAFAMGPSQSTNPIFKSWCRMLGGQLLMLLLNVWTLRLFVSMLRAFVANPVMSFL